MPLSLWLVPRPRAAPPPSLVLSLSRLSTNWPRFALGTHHLRVCNQAKVFRLSFSLCLLRLPLSLCLCLALFAFVSIEHCKHTHTHTNTHCTYLEFKVKVFQFQVLWRQVRASTTSLSLPSLHSLSLLPTSITTNCGKVFAQQIELGLSRLLLSLVSSAAA